MPVQKLASEARNRAAAPTSAGWPMRPRGWGERRRKEVKGSPHLMATPPSLLHSTWIWSPTPTWAKVPSWIVVLGSGVEAANCSHNGVQMFPGEMLGRGGRGSEKCVPIAASGAHSQSSQFPRETRRLFGAHQLTRTPYWLSSRAKALVIAVTAPCRKQAREKAQSQKWGPSVLSFLLGSIRQGHQHQDSFPSSQAVS